MSTVTVSSERLEELLRNYEQDDHPLLDESDGLFDCIDELVHHDFGGCSGVFQLPPGAEANAYYLRSDDGPDVIFALRPATSSSSYGVNVASFGIEMKRLRPAPTGTTHEAIRALADAVADRLTCLCPTYDRAFETAQAVDPQEPKPVEKGTHIIQILVDRNDDPLYRHYISCSCGTTGPLRPKGSFELEADKGRHWREVENA